MNPELNPFAALSLIGAPAVLTNACAVLALGTSNRLARTVDRTRHLTSELEAEASLSSPSASAASQELKAVQRRMLMLIRALQAFYVGIGGFASTTLISLAGAVFTPSAPTLAVRAIEIAAVCLGVVAVGGLVRGSILLVRETRIAVWVLEVRASEIQERFRKLKEEAGEDAHNKPTA